MRKPPSAVVLFLLLLPIAACAHRNAGYAPAYAGFDCYDDSDCYGGFATPYTCVFVENPTVPARIAVVVSPRHHTPRVVTREGWPAAPANASGSGGTAAGPPPQVIGAPAVPREPVILASPAAEARSPRAPN